MAKKKFPKQVFVTLGRFADGSGDWLNANYTQLDACELEDRVGKEVATYQLVKVEKLDIRKTVEVVKL